MGSAGLIWGLLAPLACVVVISAGQLLFKLAAIQLDVQRPLAFSILGAALVLYGGATVVWVLILRHAPLSRIYPLMALSFVLTPLAGVVLLKESVSGPYWLGVGLILAGLVVISRAPA